MFKLDCRTKLFVREALFMSADFIFACMFAQGNLLSYIIAAGFLILRLLFAYFGKDDWCKIASTSNTAVITAMIDIYNGALHSAVLIRFFIDVLRTLTIPPKIVNTELQARLKRTKSSNTRYNS